MTQLPMTICHRRLGMLLLTYPPNLKTLPSPVTEKCTKLEWFGVVRGHPSSSAMSPFDRARTISYSSKIETMRLSGTVFEIRRVICRNSPTSTAAVEHARHRARSSEPCCTHLASRTTAPSHKVSSKVEILSDMLRYYSRKACNYREISPPLEEFLMPFVLHSRQEVQRERPVSYTHLTLPTNREV